VAPKAWLTTIDPRPGAPAVDRAGDRGTVAVDISDRGEVLLPILGGFYKATGSTLPYQRLR
jgi:hypothetical protein